MADSGTITRIGNILKNTYGPGIVEQQNKKVFLLDEIDKMGDGFRVGGDHYEFPARVAGARAAVQAQAASDALATPTRQNEQKFLVYDTAYTGVIKVYDKDVENSKGNDRAFVSHLDNEVNQMLSDIKSVQNIDLFMDGSGILSIIASGTASATQTLSADTAFGKFGSRYLVLGDKVDIYDSTLVTSRTSSAGLTVSTITPATSIGGTATVVFNGLVTTTTGDIVVRSVAGPNKSFTGLTAATATSGNFQNLSRTTYPILKGNVITGSGSLTETNLQQLLSLIEINSGETPDMFLCGHGNFDAYTSLGYAQKRFMDMKVDKGFAQADFNGIPFRKDKDCPPSSVFAVTKSVIKNGQLTGLDWMQEDGNVLKWDAGYAAYKAVARNYGNLCFTRPNALGRIDTLTIGNAYAK
jgi:hypothetical protein